MLVSKRSREAVLSRAVQAPAVPHPCVRVLRMAGHADGETALVLHRARRLARNHDCGFVGPLARQGDRRDDYVVRNDYLRTEQVRWRSSQPHAGAAR